MISIQLIFVLLMIITIESNRSFLYHTKTNFEIDYDCFYAYIIDDVERTDRASLRLNYLTPYCFRLSSNESSDVQGHFENKISFKTLQSQQIESKDLFQWTISIDIIELYEIYLITNDKNYDEYLFYNCSLSWFGSTCQYTFGSNIFLNSFGNFILSSFNQRDQFRNNLVIHTCYPHLIGCYRGVQPICLDWREICNGIIDCIGENLGIDEEYCEELEINQCQQDEYRCHYGGQCIPLSFFRDGFTSKDCLDGTDEDIEKRLSSLVNIHGIGLNCSSISTFSCEELSCRYPYGFPCGDGDCRVYGFITDYIIPNQSACPGTRRDLEFSQIIFTNLDHLTIDCQKFLICHLKLDNKICLSNDWINCTMKYITFPIEPFLNNYFQIIYLTNDLLNKSLSKSPPDYICHYSQLCQYLPKGTIQINNLDCHPFHHISGVLQINNIYSLHFILSTAALSCVLEGNYKLFQSNQSLFFCDKSNRFISPYRIADGIHDCYYREDEDVYISCSVNDSLRFQCLSQKYCFSPLGIGFAPPGCIGLEDLALGKLPSSTFPFLCDMVPDEIAEYFYEEDESYCPLWPCETIYTRCDGIFQCTNGIDELNCSNSVCKRNELKCLVKKSNSYLCIPHNYIYEKPTNCRENDNDNRICRNSFYSTNLTLNKTEYLSWADYKCLTDDNICGRSLANNSSLICNRSQIQGNTGCKHILLNLDNNNEQLCEIDHELTVYPRENRYFSTLNLDYFPPLINTTITTKIILQEDIQENLTLTNLTRELIEYCNRGIIIYEGQSYTKKCLCPPSYFGSQCQFQNQRISLTIQLSHLNSLERQYSIYELFIYLIDKKYEKIHSYEKLLYIPSIDCQTKFNRYLLYPLRLKDWNLTYSLRIDIYNKITLDYYASWYIDIPFQFLPVHRIATQLKIPYEKSELIENCSLNCGS